MLHETLPPAPWLRLILALGCALAADRGGSSSAEAFASRWDLTIQDANHKQSLVAGVDGGPGGLESQFCGPLGKRPPVAEGGRSGNRIQFVSPKEEEDSRTDLVFDGKLIGETLAGSARGAQRNPMDVDWSTRSRAQAGFKPHMGRTHRGCSRAGLRGWTFDNPAKASSWVVENGCLLNKSAGSNIATDGKFQDFKLHIEVNCPTNANSGIYLRGRYEVQVEDDSIQEPPSHHMGAVYGFLAPVPEQPRRPGVWQTFDITLVGRLVTVVQNGQTIINHKEIPGITGGAFDSHEELPGPIYLQGDHGGIAYRKHHLDSSSTMNSKSA